MDLQNSEKYVLQRWRCWFTVTATLTNPYIFCPVFLISWTENLGSLVLLCIFHAEHSVMMLLTYFMSSSRQGQLWKKEKWFWWQDSCLFASSSRSYLEKHQKTFLQKRKKKRFEIGEVKCQTIVKSWRSSNHYWKNAHNKGKSNATISFKCIL